MTLVPTITIATITLSQIRRMIRGFLLIENKKSLKTNFSTDLLFSWILMALTGCHPRVFPCVPLCVSNTSHWDRSCSEWHGGRWRERESRCVLRVLRHNCRFFLLAKYAINRCANHNQHNCAYSRQQNCEPQ